MAMALALRISVTLVCAPASGPTASDRTQTYTLAQSLHDRALTVAVRRAGTVRRPLQVGVVTHRCDASDKGASDCTFVAPRVSITGSALSEFAAVRGPGSAVDLTLENARHADVGVARNFAASGGRRVSALSRMVMP